MEKKNNTNTSSFLIGKWSGLGEMLIKPITKKMGKLPIEIIIKKGGEISGKIGEAKLKNAWLIAANFGYELRAELDNYVNKNYQIDKDRLLVFFISPKSDDKSISYKSNFHLKSNFHFDLTPLIGGVNLVKQ